MNKYLLNAMRTAQRESAQTMKTHYVYQDYAGRYIVSKTAPVAYAVLFTTK